MIALYIFCIIFIFSPFLPVISNPHWFFRTADFIRLQSIGIQVILILLLLIFGLPFTTMSWFMAVGLVIGIIYQLLKVYPYSALGKTSGLNLKSEASVSILAANVLQTNTKYNKFLNLVDSYNPDVILTMESNSVWEEKMKALEKVYPFTEKVPQENLYGMHLFSKMELSNVSVNFQIEEDIPSIYFEYPITKGKNMFFACLHPAPPSPTENDTALERDAELMLAGKTIRNLDIPSVIFGDMNDVVWSRTSRLFKKMTGMIDPRRGRGFYATYHAGYRFMRFPLDHLFHTKDLFVGRMERTPFFGSDHFGMYYEIHLKENAKLPKNPTLDNEEVASIEKRIDDLKDN